MTESAAPVASSPGPTDAPPPGTPVVQLRGASFGYGGRAVVAGIDLGIPAGRSVALLGPNGCGKSTLVRGLLGLNQHLAGDVLVFGAPLAALRRRSRIGYVPQRHTLSASVVATVGEIVMTGRLPHLGPIRRPGKTDRAIVAHALDVVGLAGAGRLDVTHLSGGQQRRVLVARALAAQPDVLIMDEPTAGVDESNQVLLARAMRTLAEQGVTLLTVTHELEAMATAIDRVVQMSGGRIVADSPAADFLAGGPDSGHAGAAGLGGPPGPPGFAGQGGHGGAARHTHGDHHLPPPTRPGLRMRSHRLEEDGDA